MGCDDEFNGGFCVGFVVTVFITIMTVFGTPLTENTYQQTLEAIEKCKDGKWDKIDNTTIYCTDGAEYSFGE